MAETTKAADTFVLFQVAGTTYAAASEHVRQMEMVEHITPLPNAPPFVEGVVFTRGQVIPAINLRLRFGLERQPHTVRSRLLVINHSGRKVGLIVDSAREFMPIPANTIQAPPDGIGSMTGKYLKGIVTTDERIIMVLDLEELLKMESPEVPVSASGGDKAEGV